MYILLSSCTTSTQHTHTNKILFTRSIGQSEWISDFDLNFLCYTKQWIFFYDPKWIMLFPLRINQNNWPFLGASKCIRMNGIKLYASFAGFMCIFFLLADASPTEITNDNGRNKTSECLLCCTHIYTETHRETLVWHGRISKNTKSDNKHNFYDVFLCYCCVLYP